MTNEAAEQGTITLPGKSIAMSIGRSVATERTPQTSGTFVAHFPKVQPLFCDKPLRRPNRTRPLDEDPTDAQQMQMQEPAVEFWNDPAEDIYTPDDGESL